VIVAAALEPNFLPVPVLIVSRTGEVTTNAAFESVLGHHDRAEQLSRRFDILPLGVATFEPRDLPWVRVLREDFVEEQIWYDRATMMRFMFCVRGRSQEGGGVLALEDLTHHSTRLVRFADAAAVSALEPSLEDAGARLARGAEALSGAHAVFVYLTAPPPAGLRLLASSRRGITPDPLTIAVAASHTRTHREIVEIDSPEVTCAATRALLKAGLHSVSAFPMHVGPENVGALVTAWQHPTTLQTSERKMLDAVSQACATALVHLQSLRSQQAESAVLRRLRGAALAIAELPPIPELLERLADQARVLLDARYGAVALGSHDGGELEQLGFARHSEHELAATDVREARGLLADVTAGEPRTRRGDLVDGIPSVATRIDLEGQTLGSVCVLERSDGMAFTEEDERMLELFAAQAALAIGHAQQLRRADESQHRLALLHDELSAGIAHDMRTPVSSILLQIDLLLERGEQRGDHIIVPIVALGRVRDAAVRISRMVDDLFDAARIELRQMAIERRRMSLRDAITNLVAQLEPALNRTVQVEAMPDLPPVLGDPERLDEVFTNLLENAAKYSPPGRPIVVRIEPDGVGVVVSVEDQGSGILAEELPRVFDRFYQAKTGRAKKSGLGLGLYITKGLVEAHGGRIWVESRAGQGTRFHVWLPAAEMILQDVELSAP
jgi:signal transduction histidine kinase